MNFLENHFQMRESEKGNEREEGERVVGSVVFARHGNKSRKGHSEQKMMHNAPLSQFFWFQVPISWLTMQIFWFCCHDSLDGSRSEFSNGFEHLLEGYMLRTSEFGP